MKNHLLFVSFAFSGFVLVFLSAPLWKMPAVLHSRLPGPRPTSGFSAANMSAST
jgi:hypothetical protein